MPVRTVKECRMFAEELGERMSDGNIPYEPYKRAPLTTGVAALTITDGAIRFWPGNADVKVSDPNKDHRQIVLRVDERKRVLTCNYTVNLRWERHFSNSDGEISEESMRRLRLEAQRFFPVHLPRRTFENISISDIQIRNGNRIEQFRASATVNAPGSDQSFLVGMDETAPFVAPLRNHPKTVTAAHASLRPAGVPATALRQGEFFFVPATRREQKEIQERLENFHGTRVSPWQNGGYIGMGFRPIENGSSHHAMTVSVGRTRFAVGPVLDTRSQHHAPLMLDGWHRVVRNNEMVMRGAQTRNTLAHQSRSWD